MRAIPKRRATRSAAVVPRASPSRETSGARAVLPLSQAKPARLQPMVPLRNATTLLGTPALISDCAPMMLRVRPAQLTTTMVSGEGARSRMRSTNSAPGTWTALGRETRWYSSNGRLSSTTMSLRSRRSRCSSSGEMFGVALACSTNSPNALLGTLTPENSSNPAAAQAGIPPSSACTLEKPAREDFRRALDQAVAVVAEHDARARPRHQAGEVELEPAQRHRTREQEMALREDQLLAQIDERHLRPIGEHRLQGAQIHLLHSRRLAQPHVACCGVICSTLPVSRSKRTRSILSRLVPVTRMKRA